MTARTFLLLALAGVTAGFLPQESRKVQPEELLKVQLAVNRPSLAYTEDDTLRISITANKNCYLRLIYSDANGKDIIIFPNYQHRDDQVKGGVVHSVPTKFLVTPPFGKEMLHAFVSSEKFSGFEGVDRGDGLFILNEPLKDVVRKLRAGSIFGEYAEQKLEITTRAKGTPAPDSGVVEGDLLGIEAIEQAEQLGAQRLVVGDDRRIGAAAAHGLGLKVADDGDPLAGAGEDESGLPGEILVAVDEG